MGVSQCVLYARLSVGLLSVCLCVCNLSFCLSVYSIVELFIVLLLSLYMFTVYSIWYCVSYISHVCAFLGIVTMWLRERFRCVRQHSHIIDNLPRRFL